MNRSTLTLASFAVAFAFLLSSCGHTNKLAQHNLRSQAIQFRAIGGVSGTAEADIPSDTSHHRKNDLASSLGTSIISSTTADKLNRAANSDSLAANVSKGFAQAVTMFLDMRPESNVMSRTDFIGETKLVSYSLTSGSDGITAHISALSRIIERATGEIVWSYGTTQDIPLVTTVPQSSGQGMVLGAVNATALAEMSESEMAEVFGHAALGIGLSIGETLREDVAELAKK